MKTIRALLTQYRHIVLYLFFGGVTTLVNLLTYHICAHWLDLAIAVSTALAWFFSVLTAYLTNRRWVFESQADTAGQVLREAGSFFACRILTGLLDLAIMEISVNRLGLPDMVMKLASNVAVVILNYIASKLMIFRDRSAGP